MGTTAVIFKSKYGSTQKYALWLGEELCCDVLDRKNVSPNDLQRYDTIIYGGSLLAGGVSGINLIVKNYDKIRDKNIIIFSCGLADTENKSNTDHIKEGLYKIFTPEMKEKIKIFHLRGRIDYKKLGFLHKMMMDIMHKRILKKDPATLTDEDREFLATYGKVVDFTDKAQIEPIIEYVRLL